jgi:hypothetical protein
MDEKDAFRSWLRDYLEWLQTSEQGTEERLTRNNHGTCYDLQTGAIAAFLGDAELLERTFLTSRERILEQFTAEGGQPHEMTRTQTAHYCCFNLQCWVNLATLARPAGTTCGPSRGRTGAVWRARFGWLLPHMALESWPHSRSSRSTPAVPPALFLRSRPVGGAALRCPVSRGGTMRSVVLPS